MIYINENIVWFPKIRKKKKGGDTKGVVTPSNPTAGQNEMRCPIASFDVCVQFLTQVQSGFN